MKRIHKMLNVLETTYYYLTRYMICVQSGKIKQTKFFKTYDEALQWAALYRKGATVMIGKRGKLVGARW